MSAKTLFFWKEIVFPPPINLKLQLQISPSRRAIALKAVQLFDKFCTNLIVEKLSKCRKNVLRRGKNVNNVADIFPDAVPYAHLREINNIIIKMKVIILLN